MANKKPSFRRILPLAFISLLFIAGMFPSIPEEGMYPLSEIKNVPLADAGLKIDQKEIYNPNGVSLVDALVNLSGCTGSFVSGDGLIITNHHCAFRAINQASTPEHDFLENGFLAKTHDEEFPAKGYTCRITESYEDVSDQILDAVKNVDDVLEREKLIQKKIGEIEDAATNEKESITGQVSEMFAGKTYVLFKYRMIKDVRLVYAPPRSIGEFGGESDNWIWPRHTGDFSFMRAYVAPDGSAAGYSKDNIPYKPKKFLKVNADGVSENDFVFILGYPGRTFRHRPSQYLIYQKDYLLPYISNLYSYMIKQLEELGKDDKAIELKYASAIKSLANVMKNYQGKIKGLNKIDIIGQKQAEEKELQSYIDSDQTLKEKYADVLPDINNTYKQVFRNAKSNLWFMGIYRFSTKLRIADFLLDYAEQMEKPASERDHDFQEKYINNTLSRIDGAIRNYDPEFEKRVLQRMISDAIKFDDDNKITAVENAIDGKDQKEAVNDLITEIVDKSQVDNMDFYDTQLGTTKEKLLALNDPAINFANELRKQKKQLDEVSDKTDGTLKKLYSELIDVKILWKKQSFIPDANSTLRLTYGHIKGYSPADAVYYSPITTLDGVIEKSYNGGEYVVPDKLRVEYDKKDYGRFYDKKVKGLPVAILYDMDTTGGNSGSPIMNAYGELIGVNFDRAYEATINDFAWNESYSRSIGVDIRYVLWVTQKIGGADNILDELGVKL